MYFDERRNRYVADWRDFHGRRRRRAFCAPGRALAYEIAMNVPPRQCPNCPHPEPCHRHQNQRQEL